ncbi:hypothetical protein AQJ91_14070 [Streptomyces dysideae]|uniref:Peptidase inhibitor family I36 n=2 Tax=Streptomyces dysideae TaxID=909626 RepID=A0A101V136_9ACTN|nr:hypothetical protein AQJ91_14070 [Streptomyces dysideae]
MRAIGLAVATAALVGGGVAAAPSAGAAAQCETGELCLYTGANYTGATLKLTKCEYVDLGDKGWAGAIRSFDNNQTGGQVATFYTTTPLGRTIVATSTAPEQMPVFAQGSLVDGVDVC